MTASIRRHLPCPMDAASRSPSGPLVAFLLRRKWEKYRDSLVKRFTFVHSTLQHGAQVWIPKQAQEKFRTDHVPDFTERLVELVPVWGCRSGRVLWMSVRVSGHSTFLHI